MKIPKRTRRIVPKLYWVETEDHDEDWFVVANSSRDARRYHEEAEGYDFGDAWATLVCRLSESALKLINVAQLPGWPTHELLLACGAEFLTPSASSSSAQGDALRVQMGSGMRIVRIGGRTYAEGDIIGNVEAELFPERLS